MQNCSFNTVVTNNQFFVACCWLIISPLTPSIFVRQQQSNLVVLLMFIVHKAQYAILLRTILQSVYMKIWRQQALVEVWINWKLQKVTNTFKASGSVATSKALMVPLSHLYRNSYQVNFFAQFLRWLTKDYAMLWKHITFTHPGRTCQPGSGSCGWGRSSWCGSGAECRPSPPRWPVPAAGTCVHGATGPAAAE